MSETLGTRVRRLRVEQGLHQRHLAGPGVSAAYVSRIEADERRPSVRALRVLAGKLGVSAQYLETGSEVDLRDERELRLAEAELELRLGQEPPAAEEALRLLYQETLEAGDLEQTARIEAALGLAAAHRGDHAAAIQLFERCVHSPVTSPLSHPNVYVTLGLSHMALGRPDLAVGLLEDCLAEVAREARDDADSRIRFATHLSYALSNCGRFERAREVLSELTDGSELALDPYNRIRLYWSRARLAAMEGHPGAALRQIQRAIGLLELTEDTLQLARAHLLCCEIVIAAGKPEQARRHLEVAERLFELGGEHRDLGALRTQQARWALAVGELDEATTRAKEALSFLDGNIEQGSAWHTLGLAQRQQGNLEQASESLRVAVEWLEQANEWQEAGDACRAWADTLRSQQRHDEAFEALEHAVELVDRARTPAFGGVFGSR